MEYALGTDPQASDDLLITLSLADGAFSYQENLRASDASIICEMSADLVNWGPVSFNTMSYERLSAVIAGVDIRRVTLTLTNVPNDRCSFRLRVEMP
ncbi:MAG: hypothetical protein ACI9DF_003830 [Verrucomicrobiales bacterium]|jgi:hypothetical protein